MPTNNLNQATVAAFAAGAIVSTAEAKKACCPTSALIQDIKDPNDNVRTRAWLRAGEVGALAVRPLAQLMTNANLEVALAAKRGLWRMVYHAGRPGADVEKKPTIGELTRLLADSWPPVVRLEALWLLSELAGDESVDAIATLLSNRGFREDARMCLEHLPGQKSIEALQRALDTVPEDFKSNIAQSLRKRGVEVPGIPCVAKKPTKQTGVKPVGR